MLARRKTLQTHVKNIFMSGCSQRERVCHTQGLLDDFKLMIQRPDTAGVFSGDFSGGKSVVDPLSALQRTFVGSIVPLEVFQVTNATLGPQAFCEFLQKFNPGTVSVTI